jgi:serine/threonine protein kinase
MSLSPRYALSPGPGNPESHQIPKRIFDRKTPLRAEIIPDKNEVARMKIDNPGVGFDPKPYGERIGGGVFGKIYRCRVTDNFMKAVKRAFNAGGVKVFESFPALGSFVIVKVVQQKKKMKDKEFFEDSAHENVVHSKLATMRCDSSALACISNFVPEFYVSFVSKKKESHECVTLMGSAGLTTVKKYQIKGTEAYTKFYARAEQAVCALWLAGYIHGDLHRENLMVDDKGNVKLIDFGMAAKMPDSFVTFISNGIKKMVQSGSTKSIGDLWTEGKMNGTQTVVDYSNRLMKGRRFSWYNPDYKSLLKMYNYIPRGGTKLLPGIRSKLWGIPMGGSPLENGEIRQSPVAPRKKWVPQSGKYWADENTPSTYRPTPRSPTPKLLSARLPVLPRSPTPKLLSATLPVLPKSPTPKPLPKLAPLDKLNKVNAKGRKVYKDIAGRTYVEQNGKKVYVKKLFTPKRNAAVAPKIAPATKIAPVSPGKSPMINTEKVNAKKRKVFRDSKGRTYVKQGDKKVYVKKLFTPKRNAIVQKVVANKKTPAQPKNAPVTSPSINTQKVNAKKRKVFRDTKGRTYVKQGDKKVYVKKLFTPK